MLETLNDIEIAVKAYFDREHEGLQTAILTLFASLNLARVIAYVPQIVKAARDSNGASAISYTTWGLFAASNLTTALYAIICLGDLLMAAIFLGNTLACIAIIVVALRNRWQFRLRNPPGL